MDILKLPFTDRIALPDGNVLVIFAFPPKGEQHLVMKASLFDLCFMPEAKPVEPRKLTLDEQIAVALAARQTMPALLKKENPIELVPVAAPPPAPWETPPEVPPVPDIVAKLGLKQTTNPLDGIVLVNNQAGLDGADLTPADVVALVKLEADAKQPPALRSAAFRRLCAPSLAQLMKLRPHMTQTAAQKIANYRMMGLGADPKGVGSGFIPADWASFILGVSKREADAELVNALGPDYIKDNPPPRSSYTDQELNAEAAALHEQRNDPHALELRWASALQREIQYTEGE